MILRSAQGPLQLVVALILLYQHMQWSVVPGIVLLLILIPANLYLKRVQKALTVGSSPCTERISHL